MPLQRTVVRGGRVLAMEGAADDIGVADILIEDGMITRVAPGIVAESAEVIDADGMIVMPGLIDTHTHLWQTPLRGCAVDCWGQEYFATIHPLSHEIVPADIGIATYAGGLELLAHGVTTVVDFCHAIHSPEHAEAALDGHRRSGIRARFGYSMRDRPESSLRSLATFEDRAADVKRLVAETGGPLVELAVAMNNLEHVSPERSAQELRLARDNGIAAMVHSIRSGQVGQLYGQGLLGPDLQWVHATAASDDELTMLADHGGAVSVTPISEAMTMGVWPVTARALRDNVALGLGVDLVSAMGGDLFEQMRSALMLERLWAAHTQRLHGYGPVRSATADPLSAVDVLRAATVGAAESLQLSDRVGSIAPGRDADLLLLSVPAYAPVADGAVSWVVSQGSRANVHTVLVRGRTVVRSGELVDADLPQLRADMVAASAAITGAPSDFRHDQ